jgi:polyisoprenoid-binding protein YceI
MKTVKLMLAAVLLFASVSFSQVKWNIDNSHSSIIFRVKHMVISEVSGYFKEFNGASESKKVDDFSDAKVNFTIKTASVTTDNEKRDEHLRSDDFFNAAKFPELKFVSKSFKKTAKGKYVLTGDLTMRDVTKEIKLDVVFNGNVNDPWGNTRAGFKLSGKLNRQDYGLKFNQALGTGEAVVGNEVKIEGNIELVKAK